MSGITGIQGGRKGPRHGYQARIHPVGHRCEPFLDVRRDHYPRNRLWNRLEGILCGLELVASALLAFRRSHRHVATTA